LVGFARARDSAARLRYLDGRRVNEIFSDLTGGSVDLTRAKPLQEALGIAFIGTQKNGPFDVPGELARNWIALPRNPNGSGNSDVVRPWVNGQDITRRPSDTWIIDFGTSMSEADAAYYEAPFEYALAHVKPTRVHLRRQGHRLYWWRHGEARPGMRRALAGLHRYIVTPRVAKHRVFVWMLPHVVPDSATVAIAREDDTAFGILHSRFHELWTLGLCTWLGVGNDPRYTPSSTFETFPFPEGLTPNIPAKDYADDPRAKRIADAAKRLNELRENWLNPPDLVKRVPEVVPGYPDRILPVDAKAEKELKKRTLTNLYNQRPAWLDNIHRELDETVAAAYGWPADLSDDEILARLLALNLERAKKSGD
jgi:type II restriction/modification system DNA methylase subunit YeeA